MEKPYRTFFKTAVFFAHQRIKLKNPNREVVDLIQNAVFMADPNAESWTPGLETMQAHTVIGIVPDDLAHLLVNDVTTEATQLIAHELERINGFRYRDNLALTFNKGSWMQAININRRANGVPELVDIQAGRNQSEPPMETETQILERIKRMKSYSVKRDRVYEFSTEHLHQLKREAGILAASDEPLKERATALLHLIEIDYGHAKASFERRPIAEQRQINAANACAGRGLELRSYTQHWLWANAHRVRQQEAVSYVLDHVIQKEQSPCLPEGKIMYSLPEQDKNKHLNPHVGQSH